MTVEFPNERRIKSRLASSSLIASRVFPPHIIYLKTCKTFYELFFIAVDENRRKIFSPLSESSIGKAAWCEENTELKSLTEGKNGSLWQKMRGKAWQLDILALCLRLSATIMYKKKVVHFWICATKSLNRLSDFFFSLFFLFIEFFLILTNRVLLK